MEDSRKNSAGRRFSVELAELIARHQASDENLGEKEVEDFNDGKPPATKLFLESGACVYLSLDNKKRIDIHDGIALSASSFAEYEGWTDPFGAFMVTGFFCGWPVLCGAWQAPVFTLLAAIGYAMHLLFFISRRFTGAVFFMLVECAIVHVLFFAWTVTDFCHATVNYVQKVAKDRDRRYEYTNPNDSVKAALLGLAVALGSVPAFLDDKDQDHGTNGDDNDQQGDSTVQSTWQQPAVKYSPGRSILWQSSLASKGLLTAAYSLFGILLTAALVSGAANDLARNVQELIASYSTLQLVPILEILTGFMACVHLIQFSAFSIQSGLKMIYMNHDLCVIAHHVTGVLRSADFNSLEDARVFAHVQRRLLQLTRERSQQFSNIVVLGVDLSIFVSMLAGSLGLMLWASGGTNGCLPTWILIQLIGGLSYQLTFFTSTGIVNIFLRRMTPILQEKSLIAAQRRARDPIKYIKISRLLQVCADTEKFVASYHGVAVTPQSVVYLWTEMAVFTFLAVQLFTYAPASVFTTRFLICGEAGHHLEWPPSDLAVTPALTNHSNGTTA